MRNNFQQLISRMLLLASTSGIDRLKESGKFWQISIANIHIYSILLLSIAHVLLHVLIYLDDCTLIGIFCG